MSPLPAEAARGAPAPVFAALGDPTRLALVTALARGEARSIAELTAATPLTRQAVRKHLHVLEQAGLVSATRTGRESRYVVEPQRIDEARVFLDAVSRQWDGALARLQAWVEEGPG